MTTTTTFYGKDTDRDKSKSSSTHDYYGILGLKHDATQEEIDNAYKKLSTQWHPDKHKDNRR